MGNNLLRHRTGRNDLGRRLVSVLAEVVVEQLGKLVDLVGEVRRGGPAVLGVEELGRNTGAGLGNVQVEHIVGLVLNLVEGAVVDGVQDGTGVLERATLTTGGSASTNPTGVEQPGVGLVLRDLVRQHAGVAHGVQGQEGLGEAGGEGSLGLGDTVLSTSHLRGVTRDEVEHGLLGGELGDRGKDTTGVAGEEDDVRGVLVGQAGDLGVLNVLNGVSTAGVLSKGRVVVVDNTGDGVEDNVLEDGSEADGVENIGLLLGGEANALGVAATLDVEDTTVGPAVLVVTDQGTVGVGRQSGLASTRETEEDGHVAILALVGRRVEGQDVVLDGHLVEEDGEDTLLHLTSVLGTQDDHLLLGEVNGNGGGGGHTLSEAVGGERTSVVDNVVGVEVLQLLLGGADKHVAHEESMVGTGTDDTDADAVSLVPAGETIDNVDAVTGVEVVDSTLTVDAPDLQIGMPLVTVRIMDDVIWRTPTRRNLVKQAFSGTQPDKTQTFVSHSSRKIKNASKSL